MDFINEYIGKENIDQINKTYNVLSNSIKNINISSFKEDFILEGNNITYQITTSDNQKNANFKLNVSVIDLGECEKIIKRKISYEEDPTPLLILKIDVKKFKTTAVEYEVYNPYTRDKIDLSICSNTTIAVYSPITLNNQETSLYDNLNEQGYNLFDANDSFYIDPCSQYTSPNGTDVSLLDRKDYYYNEDVVLCEDICQYIEVSTENKKAYCECSVKNSVNVESDQEFNPNKLLENFYKIDTYANFEVLFCYELVFSSKGLKKNICFYIILVLLFFFLVSMIINLFSALKKIDEIIFKIFQDRFMFYFMQKIIIEGRKRRNAKINTGLNINNNINNINDKNNNKNEENGGKPKLSWLQKLKMAKQKKKENESTSIEEISGRIIKKDTNLNENFNERKNIIKNNGKKKKKKKKSLNNNNNVNIYELKNSISNISNIKNDSTLKLQINKINNNLNSDKKENNIINIENNVEKNIENENNINKEDNKDISYIINNDNNQQRRNAIILENKGIFQEIRGTNINIVNNIIANNNPPKKNGNTPNEIIVKENFQEKEVSSKKLKKRKSKKYKKKSITNESVNSIINLKKFGKYKSKKPVVSLIDSSSENQNKNNEKKEEEKEKEKEIKQNIPVNNNKNIKYIDEELNRMNYENALINDKRNYMQYYWSLLKKKHLIILTFVSNDDYNVFLLKFSLFILSLALFFSINTFFYRDSTMHQIFSQKGKYNLIYQIPQVLYSTLISFIMTLILKKLSLSQNELIMIKKELDYQRSKKLAEKSKKCLKIKLYTFFSFGLALLIFFWYYITSFAAVYINTQLHLIKDTLLSFGISMTYPLIINFIPGIFRFAALKSAKKNKKCLYRTGQVIGLF